MIAIVDIRYCRLGTADLDSTVDFATKLIGLEEVDRSNGQVYLRSDAAATARRVMGFINFSDPTREFRNFPTAERQRVSRPLAPSIIHANKEDAP
jgi:catechol 2,3-dioxygenase-like lactoylglutathione lyase family enzyme